MKENEELDLVRLAIELARLRRKTEPGQYLDEAAQLLTEARYALSREEMRPQREAEQRSREAMEGLVKLTEAQNPCIPFDKLCRPATADERVGNSELIAIEEFKTEAVKSRYGEMISVTHSCSWHVYRDEPSFKLLIKKWVECESPGPDSANLVKSRWRQAKEGRLKLSDVFVLQQMRKKSYAARGPKFADAEKTRSRRTER